MHPYSDLKIFTRMSNLSLSALSLYTICIGYFGEVCRLQMGKNMIDVVVLLKCRVKRGSPPRRGTIDIVTSSTSQQHGIRCVFAKVKANYVFAHYSHYYMQPSSQANPL